MKIKPTLLTLALSLIGVISLPSLAADNITAPNQVLILKPRLEQLIQTALTTDLGRDQLLIKSQAMRETSIAAASLPDPKLKIGFSGLPTNSFAFNQDPMTTISIGASQQFGRGSTLPLQQQKIQQQADTILDQADVRALTVTQNMTQLWLELGYQQQLQQILRQNLTLMKQLVSSIRINYAIGKSPSQDLLQGQLQVSKIEEQLQANQQRQQTIMAQLSEWLGSRWLTQNTIIDATNTLHWQKLMQLMGQLSNPSERYQLLRHNPMVTAAETAISAQTTQIAISEQAYKPQFGVDLMYGARQASNMAGQPVADVVSAFVTMDLPLFTSNRQNRNRNAAKYQEQAAKLQRDLLLQQMNAKLDALLATRTQQQQRLNQYQTVLIKQAQERTKAVERGYKNGTSRFDDVINASRDELDLATAQARLTTDLSLTDNNLAYLLNSYDYQPHLTTFTANLSQQLGTR